MKKERHTKYFIILLIFTVIVTLSTLFGKRGLIRLYHLSKERDSIADYNTSLMKTNQRLKEEINLLKEDVHYIEEIARKEFGMVGRVEVVYQFEE